MEIEFKFLIPSHRLEGVQAEMQQGHYTARRMEAHYFDTPEGDLARQGIAWRVRDEGGAWVQTVKTLGEGPLAREEHNAALPRPAGAEGVPRPDPALHAGSAAGRQLARALAHAKTSPVETYGTGFERVTRDIPFDGGGAMELALDTGRVVAHRGTAEEASAPICELELELKDGPVSALVEAARAWAARHGLVLSTLSKAERGERLRAGGSAGPAAKATPMRAKNGRLPSGQHLQRVVVGNCLEQIMANASEIAQGHGTEKHVHQLRVGIRRLRTALRELDGLAPNSFDPAWEAPLRTVFRRLGELRDSGHVLEAMNAQLRQAGGPEVAPDPEAAVSPEEILSDGAFQAVLIALMGFTVAQDGTPPAQAQALDAEGTRRAVGKALRKLHRGIGKDIASFSELTTERQHRVRKRIKRLRYLTEFLAPVLEGGGRKFLKRLAPAQASLGRLNDEQVADRLYRQRAARHPQAWFAVGWLAARRRHTLENCQRALQRIGDGPEVRKRAFRP
ncbi:CYTH and CHAD domain-containing protein [Paracidovorax konjaci]|uniref:Inorganic triphosphatase YgiF, contains CYTH and CHAD domains n=1 Tax=Paracidovorax konjaci TaxID=32040 RepID=A0A1I1SCX7_9BURK|nr:CYTH and CHAD domain-containing protein [Paracidovorax konjaci]SFD44172.1 Inorganic triphosphatase YgiF, contains CYTH and CHAD domains [Paracidovorax konjaci]